MVAGLDEVAAEASRVVYVRLLTCSAVGAFKTSSCLFQQARNVSALLLLMEIALSQEDAPRDNTKCQV